MDTVPETRKMQVMEKGTVFDRVGSSSGRCVGEVDPDGTCATREQRSIPYHLTESDITKEPSYHRYTAEKDFTRSNLEKAIKDMDACKEEKLGYLDQLEEYYKKSNKKYHQGDGLAYGKIAPMFEKTTGSTGGGYQYDMPFSMDFLKKLGMIREIFDC